MGCWNKTCGLSNLHITAGTPTYVFVLERNKDYDPCYATGLFSPVLLPFESVYDDYGGGEDSSGVALPFVMKGLKDQLVEFELGENEYHDIAVKREGFTDKLFFEACHEDRMQIQGRFDKEPTQVYFTMMRKDIVDSILETRVIEDYVGEGKGTHGYGNNYIRYKFADITASVRPLIERLLEDISKSENEYIRFAIVDSMHRYRNEFHAAKYLSYDSHRYSRIVDVKHLASRALEIGTVESINKLEGLLIEHLKAVFIDSFMHSARKTWVPGGHEGSQSSSGGALRLLAKVTIDALDKERAEWAEEMGEDADEEEFLEG
jgi:hypothetical protein